MTVTLTYDAALARVQLSADGVTGQYATVERSLNELLWEPVRGGVAAPVVGGVVALDDYEFTPDRVNHYRVRSLDISEDFEDATLSVTIGQGASDLPWERTDTQAHGGTWSLRSGAITDTQTSDAVVTVPTGATNLQFWYRVSSEAGFDVFEFLIDGASQFTSSGEVGWTLSAVYDVTGATSVTFRYSKDSDTLGGADAAYVDGIVFGGLGLAAQTASITPSLGEQVWLKSIRHPFLNRAVTVTNFGDPTRDARAGVFPVKGRSVPVSV
ncbi:MAG: hypothetical protein ACRDUA_19760, partial [Micromonosporaceae bacterium]